MLTLSETEDDEVDEVEVDEVDADDAANISLANFKIFGWATSQLQICNWLVAASNWGGISSLLTWRVELDGPCPLSLFSFSLSFLFSVYSFSLFKGFESAKENCIRWKLKIS